MREKHALEPLLFMKRTVCNLSSIAAATLGLSFTLLRADEPKPILLPPPQTDGGKPLMQALQERRTAREFNADKLPAQVLADVLWAGFGVNRPSTGYRTAPSAMNSQEVDIYVALPEGLYLYEAKPHRLQPVLGQDVRARTTGQAELKGAPVVLIFVADLSRLAKAKPEARRFYADFDTGCISENIYLYCASAGLATVVHELDRAPLAAVMKLKPEQQIILAQAVGYPREGKLEGGPKPK
jgi:nitroreductase